MTDIVDFRITDTIAVGHDDRNVIVFKRVGAARGKGVSFDGYEWRAVYFIYRDKSVLLRCLREMGVERPETLRQLASVPLDLREYRAVFKSQKVDA